MGLYLARGLLLPAAARFLDVSESPQPVDAVLVLGGGPDTRPFQAAELFRAGLTRRVLVLTARQLPSTEDGVALPEDEVIRRVLRAEGVPDEAVVTLPGGVVGTNDEARALSRFLDAEPEATVAVVTNGFHTRRARMLFRHELGARMARVHFVAAPGGDYDPDRWWRSEGGFTRYTTEYFKLAYYGLREDRTWQTTALVLVALAAGVLVVRRLRRRLALPLRGRSEGQGQAPA
jgi:uncharacterized SAM-binding protein YcdF (DUF218 family)